MSAVRKLLSIADGDNPLAEELALFIVQLVFILVVARVLGYLFRYIKQPQVVAEVITGIFLGPSVLGRIPNYMDNLFPSDSLPVISVFANIGLIFFMFLIGIELDPALLKNNAKSAIIIAIASMAAPFGIGALVSILLYNMYLTSAVKFSTFLLFVGVAMSITAFPVLARILTEQRMTSTKVGLIALSAAAVNDVVAWILLAVVVSIARASSPLSTLWTLLIMIGFFLIMALLVRPLLIKLNNAAEKSAATRHNMVIIVFLLILVSAWLTEVIGIHAIFGGFVMGVISPRDKGFALYITERMEDVVVILLLPLYFTYSGLRTNLGDLNTGKSWGICILVIALACAGKVLGSMGAAKFLGNSWRESLTVGVLMNTKGLVELIVLNLGLDVGVLTEELFDAFAVMMCVSNQVSGLAMTSIAGTLAVQKKKKFSLQALHVTEVTDSPSSYFFAHSKPTPAFMELVKERARALQLPLKLIYFDTYLDIDYYCMSKTLDLILIAWNEPLIDSSGGSKIKQVLAHTPATVGVLLNRGIHEVVNISRVLVIYTGEAHQRDALIMARIMCRKEGTDVTVLTNIKPEELGIPEIDIINVITCNNPMIQGIEESKQGYDLVVVGVSREWSNHEDTILQTTDLLALSPVSVLLVHSKMDELTAKKKKKRQSMKEDKARLFLGGDTRLLDLKDKGTNSSDLENGDIPLDTHKPHRRKKSDGAAREVEGHAEFEELPNDIEERDENGVRERRGTDSRGIERGIEGDLDATSSIRTVSSRHFRNKSTLPPIITSLTNIDYPLRGSKSHDALYTPSTSPRTSPTITPHVHSPLVQSHTASLPVISPPPHVHIQSHSPSLPIIPPPPQPTTPTRSVSMRRTHSALIPDVEGFEVHEGGEGEREGEREPEGEGGQREGQSPPSLRNSAILNPFEKPAQHKE